ncbi:4-hydroxy-2-oxovalerate aldolase [Tianweitania sp. BSSL-BM11]|uniref:4-hydroxy-2-oxovalerate aldolase n=1 Tax=Tianweitania aestuarii TaxID=2814886 RepID=A0ABS5RRP3_9HYPH|nr:aldolase/citrate lyase family protein [Tianweitania aestuarii]MBS9719713.1 4-hydroxy-2-oxovalerate aldolase [Tianweitania aestuarii]
MVLQFGKDFRDRLLGQAPVFGAWLSIPHPTIVEVMARLDVDFLLMDAEHSAIEVSALSTLLPAADLRGKPVIFRPRSQASAEIKSALDAGAAGVMVPMVESAEEACAIVAACKYAPLGKRGIGPWRASGYYDHFGDYLANANDATTVIVQLESVKGLDAVEAIAAVEGIDILYVGPADLASSLGAPLGEMKGPLLEACARVAKAARENGKIAAIDVGEVDHIPQLRDLGFSFFTIGSDVDFIQKAGRALVSDLSCFCKA